MTRLQNAYMEMFRALENYLDTNSATWTGRDFFETPYNLFKAKIPELQQLITAQQTGTTGITAQKNKLREKIQPLAEKICYAIKAMATFQDNLELRDSMPSSKSVLTRAGDNAYVGLCTKIHTTAVDEAAVLANYGITSAMITQLGDWLTQFVDLVGTPKVARSGSKRVTEDLNQLISETNGLLNEVLDTAAKVFYNTAEDFAQQYFMVRSIDDPAYGKLALRVNVIDADTHSPLSEVEVLILPEKIKRKTSRRGNCQVDNLAAGNITIKFNKFGYQPLEISGAVNDSETTELKVLMHRSG
jgi:hypothetical protein